MTLWPSLGILIDEIAKGSENPMVMEDEFHVSWHFWPIFKGLHSVLLLSGSVFETESFRLQSGTCRLGGVKLIKFEAGDMI